jgi:peptidoglycan/LPS O-acetylase OafA/YrhL
MYFYLVFAVILLLPRSALLWALLGWGGLVAVGSALGLSHTVAQTLLQLVTHAMTVEFILGALVGLAVQSGKPWRPGLVACLGAVWFAAAMVFTPVAETWPQLGEFGDFMMQWGRVVLYGVPAALVVYGLVCLEAAGRFREVRPLTVLGDWSYALYLSHILVASGIKQMLPRAADLGEAQLGLPAPLAEGLRLGSAGLADNVVFTVLALGAMIAFAGLVHHVIERPLARGVRQLRQRQQAEAAKPKAVILPPG